MNNAHDCVYETNKQTNKQTNTHTHTHTRAHTHTHTHTHTRTKCVWLKETENGTLFVNPLLMTCATQIPNSVKVSRKPCREPLFPPAFWHLRPPLFNLPLQPHAANSPSRQSPYFLSITHGLQAYTSSSGALDMVHLRWCSWGALMLPPRKLHPEALRYDCKEISGVGHPSEFCAL